MTKCSIKNENELTQPTHRLIECADRSWVASEEGLVKLTLGWCSYRRVWEASGRVRQGTVLVVHGLGEHGGRYARHVQRFIELGWRVVSLDLPGHGRSPGLRGHWKDWRLVVEGLYREVVEAGRLGPVALWGHSMGAMLVLAALFSFNVNLAWLWLSSPLLKPSYRAKIWQRWGAPALAVCLPWWVFSGGVRPEECFADAEETERVLSDPLMHGWITARAGADLLEMEHLIWSRKGSGLSCPLLITTAGLDSICPVVFVEQWIEKVRPGICAHVHFPHARHEPFNEQVHREPLWRVVREWILGNPGATDGLNRTVVA